MRRLRPAAAALLLLAAAGCSWSDAGESEAGQQAGEQAGESALEAADRSVCLADAEPVAGATDDLPPGWTFPPATTAYGVEHRAGVGTIVTAVTSTPFDEVLDHLNHQEPGVRITSGETEEHDAEANWTAAGHAGRWAIRTSATCPGETVVQVLSTPAG